jgi:gliding motility associated protien GldN
MKSRILSLGLIVLFFGLLTEASAQRTPRNKTTRTDQNTTNPQTQTQTQSQTNNTQQPSGYNPYGNIPIRVQAPAEGGFNDSVVKKSLRADGAFGFRNDSVLSLRTPLPYEHLRWDDALYTERVWRELDLREKMNMPFRYKAEEDNGDQRFISILLRAVKSGEVTAFNGDDDRFTTPLTTQELGLLTAGGVPETTAVYDVDDPTKIKEWVVTSAAFDPESVTKIRVKEEWVFDREASRMFVRIIGLAPLKTIKAENGTERGVAPMFWVYYPDLRPTLAKYEVYNPKNMGTGRMTWEELWESRMFASYIVKSTLDNPFNKNLKQLNGNNNILALLHGDNIKERIFNYEQDLWHY